MKTELSELPEQSKRNKTKKPNLYYSFWLLLLKGSDNAAILQTKTKNNFKKWRIGHGEDIYSQISKLEDNLKHCIYLCNSLGAYLNLEKLSSIENAVFECDCDRVVGR